MFDASISIYYLRILGPVGRCPCNAPLVQVGPSVCNCMAAADQSEMLNDIGCAGFSLHDGKATQAKKFFQLGPGSGRQDLRGQHQAARSLGGLVFQN